MHFRKAPNQNSTARECYGYFSDHYFKRGFYVPNPPGAFSTAGAPSVSVVNLRTGKVMKVFQQQEVENAAPQIVELVKRAATP